MPRGHIRCLHATSQATIDESELRPDFMDFQKLQATMICPIVCWESNTSLPLVDQYLANINDGPHTGATGLKGSVHDDEDWDTSRQENKERFRYRQQSSYAHCDR